MRTGSVTLRAAAELIAFAAEAEQRLAASLTDEERRDAGTPDRWGAGAVLAHLTDWKAVQVERMAAHLKGSAPPACDAAPFPHRDPALYAPLAEVPWDELPERAAAVSRTLAELTLRFEDHDLERSFPWTLGKPFAQQLLGRGVWHTLTHLTEYHRQRARDARAQRLNAELGERIVALEAWPVPNDATSRYNEACCLVAAGHLDDARGLLAEAVELDPTLHEAALHDPDLTPILDALPLLA